MKSLGSIARKPIVVAPDTGLVRFETPAGRSLPLIVRPVVKGVSLREWARNSRSVIEASLHKHGAILFRDFDVQSVEAFQQVAREICGELLEYRERSSPRTHLGGNVYTSTDYPPEHSIFLHNENSYQQTWPMKIFFFCAHAPAEGGETPIADCRNVLQQIDPEVRERFREAGWMYVRNFGDGFGLPWSTVFQTDDRDAVEEHCRQVGIGFEWKPNNGLRTRAIRPAIARHPATGEQTWFNHATFFHITTLETGMREALRAEYADDDLPTNTFYGDGKPIEPHVLDHLRDVYRRETVMLPWQQGDLMVLDNMLAAHGRSPYSGERKIVVAMGQPMNRTQLETSGSV
ncbi:MAG TPA: TauD/TfdA family dioxygenase [Pyrinomonadaceae bacterium]|nr:TauD/TfdA family dioxygenase [Pyrinomonadaceae bacterium]